MRFLLATTLLLSACNKHDVPLGGKCDALEDCASGALGCLKSAGKESGVCTTTCQVNPPAGLKSGAPACESFGMVCAKTDTPDRVMGNEYCVPK